jgi:hypothetical protein
MHRPLRNLLGVVKQNGVPLLREADSVAIDSVAIQADDIDIFERNLEVSASDQTLYGEVVEQSIASTFADASVDSNAKHSRSRKTAKPPTLFRQGLVSLVYRILRAFKFWFSI